MTENTTPTPPTMPPVRPSTIGYQAPASMFNPSLLKKVSTTAKIFVLAALLLLLMIPLMLVRGVLQERSNYRESAEREVAQGWGGPQTISPPVLAISARRSYKEFVNEKEIERISTHQFLLLPSDVKATASLVTTERSVASGLYTFPVYTADINMSGNFLASDLAKLLQIEGIVLNSASFEFLLSDLDGVASIESFAIGGLEVQPASMGVALNNQTNAIGGPLSNPEAPVRAHTMLADAIAAKTSLPFVLKLKLRGVRSITALPMARSFSLKVDGAWPDPSFIGGLLPAERTVAPAGFSAAWQVSEFNRNFPQIAAREADSSALNRAAPIVTLVQVADVYARNDRAGKYGALFLLMTFAGFFLVEVLMKIRLHPMHYLQIGLALGLFYLMLLALSEQIGFNKAYWVAATAIVLQVGGYTSAVLKAWKRGLAAATLIASLYAFLYVLIAGKSYSLVLGSFGLFALLSAVMYLTRGLNWGDSAPESIPDTVNGASK
jgi:inner membrane protein